MTPSRRGFWLLTTVLCGAAGLTSGCIAATGDSCEIKTNGISVTARVHDDGTNVRASAAFEAGDQSGIGTKLDLCDVDVLTINGNNPKRSEDSDSITYSVSWPSAEAPPSYDFKLDRTEDGDVIEWSVDLPPQFGISAPTGGDELSRAEDLELTWEPDNSGGTMNIELEDEVGDFCIETDMADHDYMGVGGEDVADTGSRTIPAGAITLHDSAETESCAATFTLMREQSGAYPSELKGGGSVTADVERAVDFTSVP